MPNDFADKLRQKRREAGLSQRRLAELAGVDFSYISKLENGRLPSPAADTICRFAKILGCPEEELLAAAKKMPAELGGSISSQPSALRFLQEASSLNLSDQDWEQMLGSLRELRTDAKRRKKK